MRRQALLFAFLFAACGTAQAQWDLEDSHSTADLRGIDNVGGGVAWASGTNGTVLRTEDGGYVWQTCSVPPGAEHLDFRGIQAFDANTAIVMSSGKGDLSRLYKTKDGCHTWKLVLKNRDKDGFWDALYFDRNQWGWLLGDPVKGAFVLYASEDAGRTWTRQHNKGLRVQPGAQSVFAASNSSLTVLGPWATFASGGTRGAFLYSVVEHTICLDCLEEYVDHEGRGDTWEQQSLPVGSQTDSSGVFSIAVRRSPRRPTLVEAMVAVGGDFEFPDKPDGTASDCQSRTENEVIVHLSCEPAQTPPHGFRSAVAYDAATKTWITVGPNGTDISTDDGRNWRALHPDPALHEPPDADRDWNALSLPFVVGPHGRIGKLHSTALGAAPKH